MPELVGNCTVVAAQERRVDVGVLDATNVSFTGEVIEWASAFGSAEAAAGLTNTIGSSSITSLSHCSTSTESESDRSFSSLTLGIAQESGRRLMPRSRAAHVERIRELHPLCEWSDML